MKIKIVGSGLVGSSAADATIITGSVSEVVLIDINKKLAQAQDIHPICPAGKGVRRRIRRPGGGGGGIVLWCGPKTGSMGV